MSEVGILGPTVCDRCIDFCKPFIGGSPNETLASLEQIATAVRGRTLESSQNAEVISESVRMRFRCPACFEKFLLIQEQTKQIEWRIGGSES
jgi:hypothetical protein